MSGDIVKEVSLVFHVLKAGILLSAGYDFFRICRKIKRHSRTMIAVEDGIFWIAASVFLFVLLYEETDGVLRWYLIAGTAAGMLLYQNLIGNYVVRIMSTTVLWIHKGFKRILGWLLYPIKRIFCGMYVFCKKCILFMKKRLTVCIKLFTMALCKQRKQLVAGNQSMGRGKHEQKRKKGKAKMPDHEKEKSK